MMLSSSKTADPLRNLLTLQHVVGIGAVVCPLLLAAVALTAPGALLPSEEPKAMFVVFLLVATSLGLDAFVAQHLTRGRRRSGR